MDIGNTRELKERAGERLCAAPQEKKILLVYCGITMGLALMSLVIRYVLGLRIDQLGGLSNMSTRATLATIQSAIPLMQSLVVMCVELGYLAAMLRIARGQYASVNTLRLGFDRFWTLMRCAVIQGLIYGSLALAALYGASMIFIMSSWGADFREQVAPLLAEVSLLNPQLTLDEETAMQLVPSMIPMFVLVGILLLVLLLPTVYRFRMANYVIIDKPGRGAMFALRESRKMMKGNCLKLLKLDLSFWWYILLLVAVSALGNLDLYLPSLGVELPLSADAAYFLFYIASLALQLAVFWFLRNRVETAYAMAYDAICPREEPGNGVVLGNIFQM